MATPTTITRDHTGGGPVSVWSIGRMADGQVAAAVVLGNTEIPVDAARLLVDGLAAAIASADELSQQATVLYHRGETVGDVQVRKQAEARAALEVRDSAPVKVEAAPEPVKPVEPVEPMEPAVTIEPVAVEVKGTEP